MNVYWIYVEHFRFYGNPKFVL